MTIFKLQVLINGLINMIDNGAQEDEEPRPIYRTMTAKEFWKLKAMAREITADDR